MEIDPINAPLEKSTRFHKKVYTKLKASPLSGSIPSDSISSLQSKGSTKKIIPSSATKGLREEFKRTFLPLLIEIFELRQMTENHRAKQQSPSPLNLGKASKSPREILERLEQLQKEMEESQRWGAGVILQILKGIEEAKSTLEVSNDKQSGFSTSSSKKTSIGILKKWLTKKK
ncbi:MAG: hypothetical protein HYZ47_05650 [Simkania negevensis]|nr:hypothetical protein [Simkania negevensis]